VLPGSTRATVVFFTNFGVAYTSRIIDVPASTGYGEPMQKLFKLRDGERVIAAVSLDPRVAGESTRKEGEAPPVHAVAVTSDGYALRFSLEAFVEASTRAGRRFARPSEGVESSASTGDRPANCDRRDRRGARACCAGGRDQLPVRAGKGVILIKLHEGDDRVLGFVASRGDRDLFARRTSRGAEQTISTAKYEVTGRGRKGP
jgi:DNA gyrase subunit A